MARRGMTAGMGGTVARPVLLAAMAGCLSGGAGLALAEVYQLENGATIGINLTTTYQIGVRAEEPHPRSFAPDTDFARVIILPQLPILPVVPTSTRTPQTYNFDDPNLNFEKGDLITNAVTALLEASFKYRDFGVSLSGNAFHDFVYHSANANDTVFPNGINKSHGEADQFPGQTRVANGGRFRLLDAFSYGTFHPFDTDLSIRVGNQVVAWGESLFFGNISLSQGVVDVTRSNSPGSEVKDILLPVPQLSMNWGLTDRLSLLGYYQFGFENNQMDGVGSFFSRSDIIGPGAEFAYGSVNPFPDVISTLASACTLSPSTPGCRNIALPMPISQLLSQVISDNLLGIANEDTKRFDVAYAGEVKPNSGQFGAGLLYDVTDSLTAGLYFLKYHDKNPSPTFDISTIDTDPFRPGSVGGAVAGLCGGLGIDCSGVEGLVNSVLDNVVATVAPLYLPYTYKIVYYEDVKLYGASATTTIGAVNVGFEFAYRQGAPLLVNGMISGIRAPQPVRGDYWQANLSGLYVGGATAWWDSLNLIAEVSVNHVVSHDTLYFFDQNGKPLKDGNGNTINAFRELTGDQTSWGVQGLAEFGFTDVFPGGWDMAVPVAFGIAFGTPAAPGALGALSGTGDVRVSSGVKFRYLNNLEIGVIYTAFFGSYERIERPLVDRDYVIATVKYTF